MPGLTATAWETPSSCPLPYSLGSKLGAFASPFSGLNSFYGPWTTSVAVRHRVQVLRRRQQASTSPPCGVLWTAFSLPPSRCASGSWTFLLTMRKPRLAWLIPGAVNVCKCGERLMRTIDLKYALRALYEETVEFRFEYPLMAVPEASQGVASLPLVQVPQDAPVSER
jgi:hypothetical protein